MPTVIKGFLGKYRFLSNFSPAQVEYQGATFQTSEAAYQAAKTHVLYLREAFAALGNSEADAKGAKAMGRAMAKRPDWESIKTKYWTETNLSIMEEILRSKFSNPGLRQQLLDTGDAILIEDNWWGDTFWGQCRGVGTNHLGKLLMKIREEIRESQNG